MSFHTFVCFTEWCLCVAGFIYGLTKDKSGPLWYISLIMWLCFPILNEIILTIKGRVFRYRVETPDYVLRHDLKECCPIVYHPSYNMTFCGLEKCHPFDSIKYQRVWTDLKEQKVINENQMKVCKPTIPDREFLQKVMTIWYLFKLNYSIAVCSIIELPLIFLPGWALRWRVLDPFQRASLGSVEAAVIAHQVGWGINLGGGFHHAHHADGGGFCVYPDITFITHYLELWYGYKRFMIIDLDAHQGNGHARDHMDRTKYCVFDVYNHYIYPGDDFAK